MITEGSALEAGCAAVRELENHGFQQVLEALQIDIGQTPAVQVGAVDGDSYGQWCCTWESESALLAISGEWPRYREARRDEWVGEGGTQLEVAFILLPRKHARMAGALSRATVAMAALRPDERRRTEPVSYPNVVPMPAAASVALVTSSVLNRGVWVVARSRTLGTHNPSPHELVRDALGDIIELQNLVTETVLTVRGAVLGQSPASREDSVKGWLGELAAQESILGARWSAHCYADHDLVAPDGGVIEVKSTTSAAVGEMHFSPAELALAARRRNEYQLVRVELRQDVVDEVLQLLRRIASEPHVPGDSAMLAAARRLAEAAGLSPAAIERVWPEIRAAAPPGGIGTVHEPERDPFAWLAPSIDEMVRRRAGIRIPFEAEFLGGG